MRTCARTLVLFSVALLLPSVVQSQTVNLTYAIVSTALDEGPQDGIFDSLTDINVGTVNNNGYINYRTALEFPLSAVPRSATVTSAKLTIQVANWEGTRSIEINGYAGNGTAELADFSASAVVGSFSLDLGYTTRTVDVTAFVARLVEEGQYYAGFNVAEEPANLPNYVVMQIPIGALPLLTVEFAPERIIDIDIRPASVPNSINPASMGTIPVAILSSADFDAAATIDTGSLTFGRTGTEASFVSCGDWPEDVNADGLPDLVCHFHTSVTGFLAGDTQGFLKGKTKAGLALKGADSVRLVR